MYNNPGEKLKGLATIMCILGIIAGVIAGICVGSLVKSAMDSGGVGTVVALLIIVVIGVASWLGSIRLYAYGELVSKTSKIEAEMQQLLHGAPAASQTSGSTTAAGRCPSCGAPLESNSGFCGQCGARIS